MTDKRYPVGYHIDMPDDDPGNIQVYRDFFDQVARLMNDNQLGPVAKSVMSAYFVYGSFASDGRIMQACDLSRSELYEIKDHLMRNDWLTSPE